MGLSFWQIAIVVLLLVLLFGRGKISDLMGDVAKGIKSFKKGMSDDDVDVARPGEPKVIDQKTETVVKPEKTKKTNS